MTKKKRNLADKLNTLLFGKDLRVTEGEPYTEVRKYDFSSYYPVEKYIKKQALPKENIYNINDYGAGTDKADNAPFINAAVAEAAKTGGTVLITGGTYTTTTIVLKSDVTLFIDYGASVISNKTGKGYEQYKAIIYAKNCNNIQITGGGKICGNGHLFGRKPAAESNNTKPADYIDVIEMRRDYRAQLRFAHESKYGGPIVLSDCSNVTVRNIIIENSAYWTFKLSNCNVVNISDFVINNNRNVANADGIDLAGSSNINIKHCFISTADDGIVLKNAIWLGNTTAMKNITIADCEIISRTNAIKVGTETTYDISGICIDNCRLFMTDLYPGSVSGISLEACDGAKLSDVKIKNIAMNRCTCPVFIRLGNRNRAAQVNMQSANAVEFGTKAQKGGETDKKLFDGASEIKNIHISDLKADNVELPIIIAGYKEKRKIKRVQNITLENILLNYADIPETVDRRLFIPEYVKVYPECWRFRNLPAYALWVRHGENITIHNFICNHPLPTWKKETIKTDCI